MDEMKRIYREGETETRKGAREIDGHDVTDDLGNLGDEARQRLGNLGDDARKRRDEEGIEEDLERDRTTIEHQDR